MADPQSTKFGIAIPKLKDFTKVLDGHDLYAEPWTDAMKTVAHLGEQYAIQSAPLLSGKTIAKMSSKVQNKPVPLYAVIKTTARSPKGYRYPRLLEFAAKWHHKGWMRNAIKNSANAWPAIMNKAAQQIAAKWDGI